MLLLLYLHVRSNIQDKYTIELRDRVTGHGVFQCVLLSSVVLNKFCSLVLKRLYSFQWHKQSELKDEIKESKLLKKSLPLKC